MKTITDKNLVLGKLWSFLGGEKQYPQIESVAGSDLTIRHYLPMQGDINQRAFFFAPGSIPESKIRSIREAVPSDTFAIIAAARVKESDRVDPRRRLAIRTLRSLDHLERSRAVERWPEPKWIGLTFFTNAQGNLYFPFPPQALSDKGGAYFLNWI